jgi:hypothetical protein
MNQFSPELNRTHPRRWPVALLLSSLAISSVVSGCAAERNPSLCAIDVSVSDILNQSLVKTFSYQDNKNVKRSTNLAIYDPNKLRKDKINPPVINYQVSVDGLGSDVKSVQQEQAHAVTPIELQGVTVVFTKEQDIITSRCESSEV